MSSARNCVFHLQLYVPAHRPHDCQITVSASNILHGCILFVHLYALQMLVLQIDQEKNFFYAHFLIDGRLESFAPLDNRK